MKRFTLVLLALLLFPAAVLAVPGSPISTPGGGGTPDDDSVTSAKILDNSVAPADLRNSSGTAGNTTYYRGDGAWATPAADAVGDNTLAPIKLQYNQGTAGATTFYRGDGKWMTVGNVVGPGTITDNTFAIFDGTTGYLLKAGPSYINPSFSTANITGANALNLGTGSSIQGTVRFKNATNGNYFEIGGGVSTGNISWTLPTAAPGGANYLLNVDADGTMGYTDPAGLGGDNLGSAAASDVVALFSGSGDYLKTDGTKGTPAGAGTVNGPATITTDNVVLWGADNTALKDSGVALSKFGLIDVSRTWSASQIFATTTHSTLNMASSGSLKVPVASGPSLGTEGYIALDQADDMLKYRGTGAIHTLARLVSPAFTTPNIGSATLGGTLNGMGYAIDNVASINIAQGATGGYVMLREGSGNGTDNISLTAPDSVTTSYSIIFPAAKCGNGTTLLFASDNTTSCSTALGTGAYATISNYALTSSLGDMAAMDNGTMTDNTFCKFVTGTGMVCNYSAVAGNPFDQDLNTNDNVTFASVSTGTSASTAGFVEMFELSGNGSNAAKITAADSLTDNVTITISSTSIALGALSLATTGTITGGVMILDNVVGPTAAQVYGSWNTITTAGTVTLPAAAPGMSTCIATEGALEITLELDGSDTFVLEGVTMAAGEAIINTTAEAAGDYICVIATSAVKWRVAGKQGTWTQASP